MTAEFAAARVRAALASWRARIALLGVTLLVVYLVLLATDGHRMGHLSTGDTDNLVRGSRVLIDCVRDADFVGCGHPEGTRSTAVGPYPLLQYLPAIGLTWLRLGDAATLSALRWISFASVLAILAVFGWSFRRTPRVIWLAWPAVLGSSLLYHANASFGEALAALAALLAVAAAASRRVLLTGLAVALACLGKETMAPFVGLLALLCARVDDRPLPPRRMTWSILLGAAAGFLAGLAFNVFRFGTPRNLLYLNPEFRTPTLGRQAEWFLALWFAPSGGLLWFWSGFVVVLALGLVAPVGAQCWSRVAQFVPLATIVVYLIGLSAWFSPFGWITFGPRLAVPLLPAALFVVLRQHGDAIVGWVGRRVSTAIAVVAVMAVAALPMYGAPWRSSRAIRSMLMVDAPDCPAFLPDVDLSADPDEYYRCVSVATWRLRPHMLRETFAFGPSIAETAWLLGAAGAALSLAAAFLPLGGAADVDGDPDVDGDADQRGLSSANGVATAG